MPFKINPFTEKLDQTLDYSDGDERYLTLDQTTPQVGTGTLSAYPSIYLTGGIGIRTPVVPGHGVRIVVDANSLSADYNSIKTETTASGISSLGYGIENWATASGNESQVIGTSNYVYSSTGTDQNIFGVQSYVSAHAASVTSYGAYISSGTTTINNPTVNQIGLYLSWANAGTDSSNKRWAFYNASTNTTAGKMFMGVDSIKSYWGTGFDAYLEFDGDSFNIVCTYEIIIDGTGTDITLETDNLYVGDGTNDVAVTFDGGTNDGILRWMEDEDYFEFADQVLLDNALYFTQTDKKEYIDSLTDGELDFEATTSINGRINGTEQVQLFDGKLAPTTTNDVDLGDSTHIYKNTYTKYISTDSNELLAHDVIRHTITAGEASGNTFTESWNKATQAKVVYMGVVVIDVSETPDLLHFNAGAASQKFSGTYNGSTITITDNLTNFVESDIFTIYIVYEA